MGEVSWWWAIDPTIEAHHELIDLLDAILEEERRGRRVYSERVGQEFRVMILLRELNPLVLEAAYLAKLATFCAPRHFADFLWRMAAYTPDAFRGAVADAKRQRKLPDRLIRLDDGGVWVPDLMAEPLGADAALPGGYHLHWSRMPYAAAMLRLLFETAGPGTEPDDGTGGEPKARGLCRLDEILGPAFGAHPKGSVRAAAHVLEADLRTWLHAHLRPEQLVKQFVCLRRTLTVLRQSGLDMPQRLSVATLTDEVIFRLWCEISLGDAELGMKRFRSGVAKALRYADAAPRRVAVSTSVSPLSILCRPPADAVKWLNKGEKAALANLLGACYWDADAEEARYERQLCPDGPFPLHLARTLLRVDVFDEVQNRLSARLTSDEIRARIGSGNGYRRAANGYDEIRSQIDLELLAAFWQLREQGAPAAARYQEILDKIGGRRPSGTDALSFDLMRRAREAFAMVNREGFRRQDRNEPRYRAAMTEAADALRQLRDHLDVLVSLLQNRDLDDWWRIDVELFTDQFAKIYGA